MSLLYYTVTALNILCNCCNLHTKNTMYLPHLYFFTMMSFIWKGDLLINNFLIYFITDLFNEKISKRLTNFSIFHHTLMIIFMIMSKLTNTPNSKYIDLSAIFEVSSIPLVLFYMGYIPKPIYNILFSYSFIFFRLIYPNYEAYKLYLTDSAMVTNIDILSYMLLNIMNSGIALQMKLVPKLFGFRPVIELFSNKRAIQ